MNAFWIADINIGYKKIIVFFIVFSFLLFTPIYHIRYIAIGILLTSVAFLVAASYHFGIFVRRYTFVEHGQIYEVKDYYSLKDPLQSARILARQNSTSIDSQIFHYRQDRWTYLDGFRQILHKNKNRISKNPSILLLGLGGGALAKTMIQDYASCHIDAVDKSAKMITVAKKYFLTSFEQKHVAFFCKDALTYMVGTKKTYDIVLVDLFKNSELVNIVSKNLFIQTLRLRTKKNATILINFKFNHEVNITNVIRNYQKIFPNFYISAYKNNFVGSAQT